MNNLINTLTSKQAAAYLSISENSLRYSRITGLLSGLPTPRFKKIGAKVIYLKSDLDEWIDSLPTYEMNNQII